MMGGGGVCLFKATTKTTGFTEWGHLWETSEASMLILMQQPCETSCRNAKLL